MRKASGKSWRGAALVVTAYLAGLAAFLAWQASGGGAAAAAASKPPPSDALELLLRLPDLPLGYEVIDGFPEARVGGLMCERIDPGNPQPKLDDFLTRNKPAGCLALYYRTYRVPGAQPAPLFVGTGAMRLPSVSGAAEGLAVAPLLLSHTLDDELPQAAAPPAVVGDATRLFHWPHARLLGEEEETVTFLVWRSGPVVAAVFVTGGTLAADDAAALQLAQRQQTLIEHPTPVTPSAFDDSEVALENPALKAPVYWLGKTFDPGHGLPPIRLQGSSASTGRSARIPRAGLLYGAHPLHPRHEDLFLDVYSAQQWKRLRAKPQPLPGELFCGASSHRLQVPGARAIALHGKERLLGRCRADEPTSWTVRVRLGGMVITAETSESCQVCAEAGRGPYDSLRGMTAIARGLVLRERPGAGA